MGRSTSTPATRRSRNFLICEKPAAGAPKLLDRVRQSIRTRHYSRRTEKAYVGWIRRYIAFHGRRHPAELGMEEVGQFLGALAERRHASASTQNQALSALLFLYRHVLGQEVAPPRVLRARRPERLPVVLTRTEVMAVLRQLRGVPWLMASLMYGAGLRLLECCQLRVKDLDFERGEILVRDSKGQKDRITVLPGSLSGPLQQHLAGRRQGHTRDLASQQGSVELPWALATKYPTAAIEWPWQWIFPATRFYRAPDSDTLRRHHIHESAIQKAVRMAVLKAGLTKPATSHTFRHYADWRIMPRHPGEGDARNGLTRGFGVENAA